VIFRREPIHKKLAREGRLEETLSRAGEPEPVDPGPNWGATGIHGVARPRRWDVVASAEAPGLAGQEVHFAALPNGDLVVEEDEPANTLTPLAEAVEETIGPPYKAEAVKRDADVWAVAARRVDVAQLTADGDELELVVNEGERTLTVDGARAFGSVPELERLGEAQGSSYVVRARRLDADLWEVETNPL
jgi:hypothetical protein